MARQLRIDLPGAIQHVTNRGNDRQIIFRDDDDRQFFLALVIEEIERCGWLLHDYALLGNHFHLLIETPEPNLSQGMQRIEGRYAQRFNRRHRRSGHLFGGRFFSQVVEGGGYLMEVSRYIALNPVRAGIVERPEDYHWSSYRDPLGIQVPPLRRRPEPTCADVTLSGRCRGAIGTRMARGGRRKRQSTSSPVHTRGSASRESVWRVSASCRVCRRRECGTLRLRERTSRQTAPQV